MGYLNSQVGDYRKDRDGNLIAKILLADKATSFDAGARSLTKTDQYPDKGIKSYPLGRLPSITVPHPCRETQKEVSEMPWV